MEFAKLADVLKTCNFEFQKLDYLYLHYKDTYPLKKEMDFDNFYFVIESSGLIVRVMGILNLKEKDFNFSGLNDSWWFIRLPEYFTKKLFRT